MGASSEPQPPGEQGESVAYVLTPVPQLPGDIDCDGDLDETDTELFVAVLLAQDADPTHVSQSDLNADGAANGLDIPHYLAAVMTM